MNASELLVMPSNESVEDGLVLGEDEDSLQSSSSSSWASFPPVFWIEGVAIMVIGLGGLVINGLAIVMLGRQKTLRVFHVLLLSLALYDFLHILLSIACFSLPHLSTVYRNQVFVFTIPFLLPCAQITLCSSSFSTVALTVERYISVCWPYVVYRSHFRPRYFILPVILFSVLYNFPRFFEWKTLVDETVQPCVLSYYVDEPAYFAPDQDDDGQQKPLDGEDDYDEFPDYQFDPNCTNIVRNVTLVPRELRLHPLYVGVYINWMNFVVNLLLPSVVLLTLNCLIYKNMPRGNPARSGTHGSTKKLSSKQKKQQHKNNGTGAGGASGSVRTPLMSTCEAEAARKEQERDTRYTKASILMVIGFLLCHGPRFVTNTMELPFFSDLQPEWFPVLVSANHLLVVVNSSFNFLIYLGACRRRKSKRGDCASSPPATTNTLLSTATHFTHQGPGRLSASVNALYPHSPSPCPSSAPSFHQLNGRGSVGVVVELQPLNSLSAVTTTGAADTKSLCVSSAV